MHTTTKAAARAQEHPLSALERRVSQPGASWSELHIPVLATGDDGHRHPVLLYLRRMRLSRLALPDPAIVSSPLRGARQGAALWSGH